MFGLLRLSPAICVMIAGVGCVRVLAFCICILLVFSFVFFCLFMSSCIPHLEISRNHYVCVGCRNQMSIRMFVLWVCSPVSSFLHSCACSFVRSCVRAFVRSCVRARSFFGVFVHSFVRWFIRHSFVCSFVCSFVRS